MKVKAKPGTRCPKEAKPREYITDSEPVDVPDSAYYRRLLADGSLVIAENPKPKAAQEKAKKLKQKPANKNK